MERRLLFSRGFGDGNGVALLDRSFHHLWCRLLNLIVVCLLLVLRVGIEIKRVDARGHIALGPFHGRAVEAKVAEASSDIRVGGGGLAGEFLLGEGGELVGEGGLVGQRGPALVHGGRG